MFKSLPVLAAGRRHLAALWLLVVAGACLAGYLFAAGALHRVPVPAGGAHASAGPASTGPASTGPASAGRRERAPAPAVPAPLLHGVPAPVITRHPGAVTRSATAAFWYADRNRATGFVCSLDGAPFAPCPRGGVTYRGLRPGGHAFAVAVARGGQVGRPARFSWWVLAAGS